MSNDNATRTNPGDHGTHSFVPNSGTASFTGEPRPAEVFPEVPGYELTQVLGRGGMGVVYLARQLATNRVVALKMITAERVGRDADRDRFRTEVELTARLSHANIVQVYEAGEAGGRAYLVCEYIAGGSLSGQLDGTPWPAENAARILVPLARALAAAHGSGVIHRDIKPSNVLVAADGTPKVADFGVAKQLGKDSLTHTGAVLGTPSYMAPEQAGGAKAVGPAADVYGLGAVLYELLTGRPPFAGSDFIDTLDQVRTRDPIPPRILVPKLPRDAETICLKCLQKDASRRYTSADDLADDLERFLNGQPIVARPVSSAERAWKWVKRNKSLSTAVAGIAAALIVGTVVASGFAWKASEEAERASNNEQVAKQKAREADNAAAQASRDRDLAVDADRENRRRMVRLNIMTGTRSLDAGDPAAALLWFHQAWELDRADSTADASHRARLAGLLQVMPDLVGVCFHPEQVCDAVFSPDGTRVLARTTGSKAYIWDWEKSRLATLPLVHAGRVRHVCWSTDGSKIATGSADGTVAVWDAKSGAKLHVFELGSPVNSVAWNRNGVFLFAAPEDGSFASLWPESGTVRRHELPAKSVIEHIDFSPDGERFLTAHRDDTMRVWGLDREPLSPPLPWKAPTATERYQFHFDRWPKFARDGQTVVSAKGEDLIVWPGKGGAFKTFALGYGITEVHFIGKGERILATGNKYNRVAVVNAADGTDAFVLRHPRQANIGAASADGKLLLTASSGGVIHLWDAATGQPLWQPQRCGDFASAVAFSADGKRCLAASQDGTIRVWNTAALAPEVEPYRADGRANRLVLPAPNKREVVSNPNGSRTVQFGGEAFLHLGEMKLDHPEPVRNVQFSDDGKRLVVFGTMAVRAWDVKSNQPAAGPMITFTAPPVPPATALQSAALDRLCADGSRLATWDDPKTISVWDLTTGKRVLGPWKNDNPGALVFGPKEAEGQIMGLVLSSDGKRLAIATDSSGTFAVLDVDAGKVLHQQRRYRGYVQGFGFSSDGKRLLLWASDNTARVYESETGTPVGPALRPAQTKDQYVRVNPNECAISADGRRLAFFESVSGTVRLWDADRADALLAVAVPEKTAASRMWFAPDGSRVNLVVAGKALGVAVPRFDVPADLAAPLVRLFSGQRIDETDGIDFVDQFAFRNDPDLHRTAFLAWRRLSDDPGAQPVK